MTTGETPVKNLMTEDLVTVVETTAVEAAAARMVSGDVQSLVVVDTAGRPVGMFTTTDLAEIVTTRRALGDATVADHMTRNLITVDADTTVQDAAATLIEHEIHHLPVTDGDDVVGMLSALDQTAFLSSKASSDAA
jgi:CBS domain-containing protein